jgi:glycosyltransferase involved in cell wall biosynthesis
VAASRKRIVIVLPVFNDGPSLVELVDQLATVLHDQVADTTLIVVDDGSLPPITESLRERLKSPFSCTVLTLKRNVGHQRAIAIGIAYAVEHELAECVVVMDADGEDSPRDLLRLLAAIDEKQTAIIVAGRAKRSESLAFRIFYQLYQLMFRLLTGYRIGFGNFVALPLLAARRLANMGELWLSLPATILRSRVPTVTVPTERGVRFHGSSQMNFVSLVVHGLRAMAVFVENMLTRIILGAMVLVLLCAVASIVAIVEKFTGIATSGWMTTVVGVSLMILLGTVILCFVSLAISIAGGAQSIPPPLLTFQAQIDRVTQIDPKPRPAGGVQNIA